MFGWLWKIVDWSIDRPLKLLEDQTIHGRFEDGRKYTISPDGAVSLNLDDELTRKLIVEKMEELDRNMRKNQPHMYDKDGNFIGGVLKGYH